jgi:hypothetical protein
MKNETPKLKAIDIFLFENSNTSDLDKIDKHKTFNYLKKNEQSF